MRSRRSKIQFWLLSVNTMPLHRFLMPSHRAYRRTNPLCDRAVARIRFWLPLSKSMRPHPCTRIVVAEVAAGATGGWGSYEIVQFRCCPYLSRHYGW
ncbi:hypothetical protein PIB30_064343 [Stylosanthes scabra]|uniref:Secreted protein n=1 Tax=Stylosanthes scabra TaxID=79078 RepID=A0ABU6ZKD9_9FABA|nr:hypothetical protein [Stylosanthes scabra]